MVLFFSDSQLARSLFFSSFFYILSIFFKLSFGFYDLSRLFYLFCSEPGLDLEEKAEPIMQVGQKQIEVEAWLLSLPIQHSWSKSLNPKISAGYMY